MARLRVQEVASAHELNMSQLHTAVNKRLEKGIAMGTIRRYWYSTQNGSASGDPIALVDIHLLGTIANVLGVPVSALLNETELGQKMAA